MSERKVIHRQVEQACWGLLGAIQLLPLVVKVPIGVQLLVNSTVVVILGALKSVDLESKADQDNRLLRVDLKTEGQQDEFLGQKDALMFPITASVSLFGLYILFTYINKELIKSLLKVYFSFIGMYAVGLSIAELLIERDPSLTRVTFERNYGFKIPYLMDGPFAIKMRKADNYGFAVGFALAAVYCLTSHWLLNNFFGITFTIGGIRLLKVSNIKTGLIMLWGLFIYDIFWVFKTDVMITVAKSIDGPILLKFPVNLLENKFSMLGLGDMIVPGVFVSLLLKFDLDNYLAAFKTTSVEQIKTPFFWYQVVFYFLGIAITYIFMAVFEHPQPALLYLVPAATIGLLIPALQQKDLSSLLAYTATEEESKPAEKKD